MKKITGLIALLVLGIITTAWARPASDVAMQAMGTKGFAREKIQMFDSGTGRHRIGDRYKDVPAEGVRLRRVSKDGSNSVGILTGFRSRHDNSIATIPSATLGKISHSRHNDSIASSTSAALWKLDHGSYRASTVGAMSAATGSNFRSRHNDSIASSTSAALWKLDHGRNSVSRAGAISAAAGKTTIMAGSGSRITSAISKSSYKSSFTGSY
ncbi:MAG: hypothetical protein ABSB18_05415 [Candidatus Omnitrophota bacterium]